MKTVRDLLFKGMTGCSDHACLITGPKEGMGTNGGCRCLLNMSRSQLSILSSRLSQIAALPVLDKNEQDALVSAKETAMRESLAAPLPHSADFAGIAQDLDYLCSVLVSAER